MKTAFVDTWYWVAVTRPGDSWSERAEEARRQFGDARLVTTEYVLIEFLNAFAEAGSMLRSKAVKIVRSVLKDPTIRVVPGTHDLFIAAIKRYEKRNDKGYSLVDCASMNIMERSGIRDVLTGDHHFEQEGFTILMKR